MNARPETDMTTPSEPALQPGPWDAEIAELRQRRAFAEQLGGEEAVAKHRARGYLTIRERIDGLVDTGSFQEVGQLAGKATYEDGLLKSVVPSPYVMGLAQIDGRSVAVGGEDFTVRGGSSAGGFRRKGGQGGFADDLALNYRLPLISLVDGAGGSVTTTTSRGYPMLPGATGSTETTVTLLGQVPVVAAVLGTAAGGPAIRAVLAHWSVMVAGTSIFAAGPKVVERSLGHPSSKEELGGTAIAVEAGGTVHDVAPDEATAFEMIRRYLSYMPSNVWEAPPEVPCTDPVTRADEMLARIVPRNRRHPYDMRKLLRSVVDLDSTFEIQRNHARSVITSLARMNGKVVGIIASNPMVNGGAVDAKAARKQVRFMELCNMFHIPVLFVVDAPGVMVGVEAERAGTLREGARVVIMRDQLTVPVITLIVRKCYGMAGASMLDRSGLRLRLAWPSAEWGSLPIEGGVAAAFRSEIESAPDPKAKEQEIEDRLRAMSSPFRTAEAFAVEDIIDPRETRRYLCAFLDASRTRIKTQLGPKFSPRVAV